VSEWKTSNFEIQGRPSPPLPALPALELADASKLVRTGKRAAKPNSMRTNADQPANEAMWELLAISFDSKQISVAAFLSCVGTSELQTRDALSSRDSAHCDGRTRKLWRKEAKSACRLTQCKWICGVYLLLACILAELSWSFLSSLTYF